MKWLSIVLCVVSLLNGTLLGQETTSWRKDGQPVDAPNMKSKEGFGAQFFLTESTQFFKDWDKPKPPKFTPLETARRNVPFFTAIIFVDPGTNAAGVADVTCNIIVRKPDGSIYGQEKNLVGWKEKYIFPAHNLQLAQAYMGIRIEPQDPTGTYTVEVLVRDNIKKIELPLKTTFKVPAS